MNSSDAPVVAAAVALLRAAVFSAAACAVVSANAQPHAETFGPYTIRSTVVSSERIAEETARNHGIEPSPDTAVLNVVLLKDKHDTRWPVRASVQAQRSSLAGVVREIEMREVANRGRVSYVGTFDFVPREVVDIAVTVVPEAGGPPMTLSYRERMPPTQLPPATR